MMDWLQEVGKFRADFHPVSAKGNESCLFWVTISAWESSEGKSPSIASCLAEIDRIRRMEQIIAVFAGVFIGFI